MPRPLWNLYQKPDVCSGSLVNGGNRCGGAAEKAAGQHRATSTHRRFPLMNKAHEVTKPFVDGNGRVVGALANALIDDASCNVGMYVVLEQFIAEPADRRRWKRASWCAGSPRREVDRSLIGWANTVYEFRACYGSKRGPIQSGKIGRDMIQSATESATQTVRER